MKSYAALLILVLSPIGQDLHAEEQKAPIRASEYQRADEGPAIIIRRQDDQTYYEYRVNGELQEIRVEPKVGPVYYLIPVEGGFTRRDQSTVLVPSWVLFRW